MSLDACQAFVPIIQIRSLRGRPVQAQTRWRMRTFSVSLGITEPEIRIGFDHGFFPVELPLVDEASQH